MPPRIHRVRYFFDEDVLMLGKMMAQILLEATHPGDPGRTQRRRRRLPCTLVQKGDKDDDWIPRVAEAGWLIITRDSKIQRQPRQKALVRESGARMVALNGLDAVRAIDQLKLLMRHWDDVDALVEKPGPYIYTLTKTTMRPIDLT